MIDNTDTLNQADTYFREWITYSPKLFPGFVPVVGGKVMGLAGKGLSGTIDYNADNLDWVAPGIPAYPLIQADSSKNIMLDPFGGVKRNPYPMTNVYVKDSTGTVVASTNTVTPVAFGGCCSCHLTLA